MRTALIAFLAVFLASAWAVPGTINVPGDYNSIQEAIDAAVKGDTVLVAPGTYHENITFKGKAIAVQSSGGPEATVIEGSKQGPVAAFVNFEGLDSVLEGFTLTNGWGFDIGVPPSTSYCGGGAYCQAASPLIRNNILSGNHADHGGGIGCRAFSNARIIDNIIANHTVIHGGAVFCDESSAVIEGNRMHSNGAQGRGGGIYGLNCLSLEIRGNVIMDNTAYDTGGGLHCFYIESLDVAGNLIAGNSSGSDGSGMLLNGCSSVLVNNLIVDNQSGNWGGGIFCPGNCQTILTNNTLSRNTAVNWGGGFCCWHRCDTLVSNTVFFENEAPSGKEIWLGNLGPHVSKLEISHSLVEGGMQSVFVAQGCTLIWGPGMIDADPLFVDLPGGDFHLTFQSPCKDTGNNAAPSLPDCDFESDPRIAHGTVDMGADEFHTHLYATGDAVPGGNAALNFIGLPGTAPVGLFLGKGVLDPPIPTIWGDWYLQFPIIGPMDLGAIPSPKGVLTFSGTIPLMPPPPYTIHLQALIGDALTNPCLMGID